MSAEFVSGAAVLIGIGFACFPALYDISSAAFARVPSAPTPLECPASRCACEVSVEQSTLPGIAFLVAQAFLNLLFFILGWCLRAGVGWPSLPPRRQPRSLANLRAALSS